MEKKKEGKYCKHQTTAILSAKVYMGEEEKAVIEKLLSFYPVRVFSSLDEFLVHFN